MKKFFLVTLWVLAFFVLLALALFYWFIYTPAPERSPDLQPIQQGSLSSGGRERRFDFYLPSKPRQPAALLFMLHGSMSRSAHARQYGAYRFEELAEEHGFIAVFPQGYDNHWNDCRGTANYKANTENIDDVAFFRALTAWFATEHNADTTKVFATGVSNGGHMALKLALEAPDLVAAVAPVAASEPDAEHIDCSKTNVAVPILFMNGTADNVNPYDGGVVSIFGDKSRGVVLSTQESVDYWRKLAAHSQEPEHINIADTNSDDGSTVEIKLWQDANKADIAMYTIRNGGHNLPSIRAAGPRFVGNTNADIEGADEIWKFFARQTALAAQGK